MRVALDTNLLVHAEGVDGPARRAETIRVLRPYRTGVVFVPIQAPGELFAVLTRKARRDADAARHAVGLWLTRTTPVPTTEATLHEAMQIVVAHRFASGDAIILAAAQAECRLLLSGDMQDGLPGAA